ncbi:MAG: hypothetical protein K9G48_08715 [Reyranella sp.]|nr:hypothetical protein [Reyranella sp.]
MKLGILAVSVTLMLWAGTALAAPPTAKEALPGCRFFADGALERRPFSQGDCAGTVYTLMILGPDLPDVLRHCVPDGVTTKQAVQVVVTYIDRLPQRMGDPFLWLSVEALRAAWPCK